MNVTEVKHILNEYGDDLDEDVGFTVVKEGDVTTEHKTCFQETVYFHAKSGKYFLILNTWDNSGYWSDGESYPPEVFEVEPVTVTVTEYHLVKGV